MSHRRRAWRVLRIFVATVSTLALAGAALMTIAVLSRAPLRAIPSTTHPSIPRQECIDCHAPIAAEWRQSFHYRSLTGPYWKDVRELGYMRVFDRTRKACVNCHSPANVLDLHDPVAAAAADGPLGVECTPNLLREPRGVIPAARADDVELGVDCASCHVGERGIVGPGRNPGTVHEVIPDRRFQDLALASDQLCGTCHSATVRAWKKSAFASRGVTCIDCHMPPTTAASVTGGPQRLRRSHNFIADKQPSMLEKAVNASLAIGVDGRARFRLTNDRVGHYFPSGGNWLSVQLEARDGTGRVLGKQVGIFGKEEPLLLDFWPFNTDRRLASGEARDILFQLPDGHGTVRAVVRYHDWMRTKTTILTVEEKY